MSEQPATPPTPASVKNPEPANAKQDASKAAPGAAASAASNLDDIFPVSVSVGSVYDGPLDLLLDLIRKQDIDIYDIPIAQITAQYLAYVEHIRNFDIDLAAEFIYTASMLIQIKSKMLLPRNPDASPDEQDPRLELVNRLLEHERYKQAAQMLLQKQQLEEAVLSNPALKDFRDAEGTEPELAADVIDLVRTFQQVLDRAKNRPSLRVDDDSVTVAQMIEYVRRRLMVEDRPIRLKQLLRHLRSRSALVCSFLAILEMIRLQAVICRQDQIFGEVVLKKSSGFDRLVDEGNATVRDDWQ
jgi:segregation and condensation protein A